MAHDTILALYRQAPEVPAAEFALYAQALLRRNVRCQSLVLASGYLRDSDDHGSGLVALEMHTHEIDPAGLAEWKRINCADKVIPVALARPWKANAFRAPTLFAAPGDAVMRDYARRYGRQSYLNIALGTAHSTLLRWCSVYRPDPDDAFDSGEREGFTRLTAHIAQALEINALVAPAPATAQAAAAVGGVPAPDRAGSRASSTNALVSRSGSIVKAQPGFLRLCARQWPEFDGRRLPRGLCEQLPVRGRLHFSHASFAARPVGDQWLLSAAEPPTRVGKPPLSRRRLEVATLFAQGHSCKEIAQTLGVAHATVRTQLQAAYQRLGVGTRSALRAALRTIHPG